MIPKLSCLLTIVFCLIFIPSALDGQNGTWAISAGGSAQETPTSVAVDQNGNAYVCGTFRDTVDFQGNTLISKGQSDIFVAKFDKTGNLDWVRQFGWKENDFANVIKIDGANLFIAGEYQDSSVFNIDTLFINQFSADTFGISDGKVDIYVLKLDTAGNYFWVSDGGGWGSEFVHDIEIASNGDIVVCGEYRTRLMLNDTLLNDGYEDIFWAKMDVFGNWYMTRKAGGSFYESGREIEIVGDSVLYIAGHFQDTTYFRDSTVFLSTLSDEDIYLAKYTLNGTFRWVKQFGGKGNDRVTGMASDANGNLYLSGYFEDTATFQSNQLISAGNTDAFLMRTNGNGDIQWIEQGGGPQFDVIEDISLSASNTLGVTGFFQDNATFGPYTLSSGTPFNQDVFFGTVDLNGNANWYRAWGGESVDAGKAIGFDPQGYAIVLGEFGDSSWFGQQQLVSNGALDMFLLRVDEFGSVDIQEPELASQQLELWPVPAGNTLNIRVQNLSQENCKVQIFDLNGREVYQKTTGSFDLEEGISINTSAFPSGFYLLQIQNESAQIHAKFLVGK